MVQISQTSWQEYSLPNVLETLRYAPMNLAISKTPLFHYTLPSELAPGASVNYHIQCGFKAIKWTGVISSFTDNKVTVRLGEGPFRGFTASHQFVSEGTMTACYDEFSFQGFNEFPEEAFAKVMDSASIVYAIASRKDTRDALAAIESKKQTQGFNAIDQSATAG